MYIKRNVTPKLLRLSRQYPVVTVTGPRQSGKTTLCRKIFTKHEYVSLEDITNRDFAREDPKGFLKRFGGKTIIDEIQRVPELLSYIQGIVDEKNTNGMYVLTGSCQFEMMASVTQSLAGRSALARLYPFSYDEVYKKRTGADLETVLYTGFYPRIFSQGLNPTEMYSFYTNAYIERDIRQVMNIQDLHLFERFLRICAGRNAQVVNFNSIAGDCGVDNKTVKRWLSLLEASYIVKLLRPYYKNINKRLTKSPKLYFCDTGLVCYLLEIKDAGQLRNHPLAGAIFESYVLSEIWKYNANRILSDNVYFFRDTRGREVDVIFDQASSISQMEIKKGATVNPSFFKTLKYLECLDLSIKGSYLIYGGTDSHTRQGVNVFSWRQIEEALKKITL
mgnify:CR=1 FL=1